MRKYMNNHFGYSRIFRSHARFAVDPGAADESGDGVGNDINVSGGGASEQGADSTQGNDNKEEQNESLEAMKKELAQMRADNERYKNSISKLNKQNSELTKKNREMMSTDQLEKEAQEQRERRFAEMEKELRTNKYSKRLVGVGMTESDADSFAATMPEIEDADAFFTTLGKFVQAREKAAADKAIQDLLKSRPDIHAGNGDSDKDDPAMALAKRAMERRGADYGKVNQDIIQHYIR